MISAEKFAQIRERYGQYSSWAIWDPLDIRDTAPIERATNELRADVVMVALNVSADVSGTPWTNFHMGRNDPKLRRSFNDSRLRGAYMTDILKDGGEDIVDPKAADIMRKIRRDEIDVQRQVRMFVNEMSFVGADATSLFLVFGGHAKKIFQNHLATKFAKHVYCQHFACYRTFDDWNRDLWRAINDRLVS